MTNTAQRDKAEGREGEATLPEGGGEDTGREAFPRMVFRYSANSPIVPIGAKVGGGLAPGVPVDSIICGNPAALQNALDHGWSLDPQQARDAHNEEVEARMNRREGKGGTDDERGGRRGKDGQLIRDKNYRDVDQHEGTPDYSETVDNPRPNEPDNAPFQNTPYVEPQTGDLPEPPTSPAEIPVPDPVVVEDAPIPGEDPADTRARVEGRDPREVRKEMDDDRARRTGSAAPAEGKAHEVRGETHTGDTGRDSGDRKPPAQGGATKNEDDKALRDKGAPPGSRKA